MYAGNSGVSPVFEYNSYNLIETFLTQKSYLFSPWQIRIAFITVITLCNFPKDAIETLSDFLLNSSETGYFHFTFSAYSRWLTVAKFCILRMSCICVSPETQAEALTGKEAYFM